MPNKLQKKGLFKIKVKLILSREGNTPHLTTVRSLYKYELRRLSEHQSFPTSRSEDSFRMSSISGVLILYSLLFRLLRGISITATHGLVVAGSLTDFENYNSITSVHFACGCWLGKSSWFQNILFNSVPKQLFFQMLKFPF